MSEFEYRVTKYNPIYRDKQGRFLRNEWTFFGEIGKSFDNVTLTLEEYERVETAYVQTVMAFLRESGKPFLQVARLQNSGGYPIALRQGDVLREDDWEQAFRDVLRERYWCNFENSDSFVHFGWDYYMYIGVPVSCEKAIDFARDVGLFVEPFLSPYK